ncbi:MAG: DUF5024 domain-containing protein [Tannerellaceae bacterium]|jgi:NurA-like 5'-3' nuclease|nr:DUF5024 domain-containing protein [Tannerellaceae bacterium]
MRTRNVLLTAALLIAAAFAQSLYAQENVKAIIEKCQSDSVDMAIIKEFDPATGKTSKMITSVHIVNDQALVNEFIEASKKDEGTATKSIHRRQPDGSLIPSFIDFNGIAYNITVHSTGTADVSMIEKYE